MQAGTATVQQMTMARAVNAAVTIPNLINQAPAAIETCNNNPFSADCLIKGGSLTLTAIGGLSDAIYTGKQIMPQIEESQKLYAFNQWFKPKTSSLYEEELKTVKKIGETYMDYGAELRKGYTQARAGDPSKLYELAEQSGYTVKEIQFGDKFLNTSGQLESIRPDNAARLGKNNTLYVGNNSGTFNPRAANDLCHDVATCLLGGKIVTEGVANIRPSTLQDITETSVGTRMSLVEMKNARILTKTTSGELIPGTWLFDALIHQKIKYGSIKYMPN